MKNIVFITMLLSAATLSYAQERTSSASLTFASKSPQFTESVGWYPSGSDWIDNKDQISSIKMTTLTGLNPNFKWMQMATVMSGGKKYYTLIFQKVSGAYDYPLTQVDWKEFDEVYVMIMDPAEYAQFKSIVTKKDGADVKFTPKIDIKGYRLNGDYDEAKALSFIQQVLTGMNAGNSCFLVNSQTLKGEDVFRFLIPGHCSFMGFKYGYFEAKISDFKKLLID